MTRLRWFGLIGAVAMVAIVMAGEPPAPGDANSVAADKAALAPWQALVGQWKGVGQPQRGSAKNSWTEKCDWAWQFSGGRAELMFHTTDGKYFSQARLRPTAKAGEFELLATLVDGKTEARFAGSAAAHENNAAADGKLIVHAEKPIAGQPAQVTLQIVAAGDRLLMLYEQQAGDRYSRLAEVGYTREGIVFAKGSGQPECIVTGGVGTIAVQYKGETYYVCCSGCRALFLENPEAVLAEYRQRKAQSK